MRPQKVSVDFWKVILGTFSYLLLAVLAWVLLKLLNACFWLPNHLKERDRLRALEENVLNEAVEAMSAGVVDVHEEEQHVEEVSEVKKEPPSEEVVEELEDPLLAAESKKDV